MEVGCVKPEMLALTEDFKEAKEDIKMEEDIKPEMITFTEPEIITFREDVKTEGDVKSEAEIITITGEIIISDEDVKPEITINKADFSEIKKRKRSKPKFTCDVCNKQYVRRSYLDKHRRRHADRQNHTCDVCLRNFHSSKMLEKHAKIHESSISIDCPDCDYKTFRKISMIVHGRNRHDRLFQRIEGYFRCELCPEKFAKMHLLNEHMAEHSLKTCKVCLYCTLSKSDIADHMEIHCGENIHKSYRCLTCNEQMITNREFVAHVCQPYDFKCDKCDFSTADERYLTEHLQAGHDVNVFELAQCGGCAEFFKNELQLAIHAAECVELVEEFE